MLYDVHRSKDINHELLKIQHGTAPFLRFESRCHVRHASFAYDRVAR